LWFELIGKLTSIKCKTWHEELRPQVGAFSLNAWNYLDFNFSVIEAVVYIGHLIKDCMNEMEIATPEKHRLLRNF
jgi:hypothetical protein